MPNNGVTAFCFVTDGVHVKGMLSVLAIRDLNGDWLGGVGASTRDILGAVGSIAEMNERRERPWDELPNGIPLNCLSLVLLFGPSGPADVCRSVKNREA